MNPCNPSRCRPCHRTEFHAANIVNSFEIEMIRERVGDGRSNPHFNTFHVVVSRECVCACAKEPLHFRVDSIRHISEIVLSGVEREISSNHVSWRADSRGRSGEWRERSERVPLGTSGGGWWCQVAALALASVGIGWHWVVSSDSVEGGRP